MKARTRELTVEQRLIARYQATVAEAGYRWEERTFNDGGPVGDTMLSITQDRTTDPLLHLDEKVGWGRFSRADCWRQAADFVETFGTVAAYREARPPRRKHWQEWADVL